MKKCRYTIDEAVEDKEKIIDDLADRIRSGKSTIADKNVMYYLECEKKWLLELKKRRHIGVFKGETMAILEIIVVLIKGFLAGICVLFGAILAVEAVVEIMTSLGYGRY